MRAFGVSKVFLPYTEAHPNVHKVNMITVSFQLFYNHVHKVLDYYREEGLLDSPHFTFPGFAVNLPVLQNQFIFDKDYRPYKLFYEKLPYNLCLYTYMYKIKYLATLVSVIIN